MYIFKFIQYESRMYSSFFQSLPYMIEYIGTKYQEKKKMSNEKDLSIYYFFPKMWKEIKSLLFSTNSPDSYLIRSYRKKSSVISTFSSTNKQNIITSTSNSILNPHSSNTKWKTSLRKNADYATFEETILYEYLKHYNDKSHITILITKFSEMIDHHQACSRNIRKGKEGMLNFTSIFINDFYF